MRVRHAIISFTVLTFFLSTQKARGQVIESSTSGAFNHGVVVEKITKDSEGERAGLVEGDILLMWLREDAKGEIDSPFDLASLETEQAPRGEVTVRGIRGSEKRVWILGTDTWGIATRPNFPKSFLALYLQCEKLANASKVTEAVQCWRTADEETLSSVLASAQLWLLVHTAETLAGARQWKQAGDAYREAIQREVGLGPTILAALLRSFAKALQSQGEWNNAAAYYQLAAEASQRSGIENLTTAASFDDLANLAKFVGDFAKVEDYSRKALPIQEKLAPSSLAIAITLNNLGLAAWRRDDLAAAESFHRKALAIRTQITPGSLSVAESLNGLGLVASARHDLDKSEGYHRQSLEIREKLVPGSMYVAASLNNLGAVNYARGDLAKAEAYFRRALAIKEALSPGKLDIVTTLGNLGVISQLRGDLVKAEEYARRALAIQERQAPDSLEVALGYENLGLIMAERDDLDGAEEAHRRALAIQERLAPDAHGTASCLHNLGTVARLRGDLTRADEYCHHALLISERLSPGGPDSAASLNCLGLIASDRGDLDTAKQFYNQALAIRQKLSLDSLEVGYNLADLAFVADRRGELDDAEKYARQALSIEDRLAPNTKEHAAVLATLARIMRHRQQPEAAEKLFEQALNALELQVTRLGGGTEARSEFRAKEILYYKDYMDLSLERNRIDVAFRVLERSRARGLLETLAEAHMDILKGVDVQLVEEERSLKESITAKSALLIELLNGNHTTEQVTSINNEISTLFAKYQGVETLIREVSPGYASLTQPQPLSVGEVQKLLDSDTLLLEYALGEERSYVFAVTLNSIAALQLPKRSEIEASAREVYDLIAKPAVSEAVSRQRRSSLPKADAQYAKAVEKLSRMVLAPVAGLLNRKRLLIVSDGALQYIPFAILRTPEPPFLALVMEHEIVNLPSASVLATLRHERLGRKAAPKAIAVLADPVFDVHDDRLRLATKNDRYGPPALSQVSRESGLDRSAREVGLARGGAFPRLPFSRREADAIYSIARQGDVTKALDFNASKATAMNPQLRDYRIVHFATHGLLNSEHPELSGLVFSLVDRQGKAQDGFLRLLDIYNLDLNADLVVLSACQTALGKQIDEEGLVGLTRGFMYAGAQRVMASLWKVDDEATAALMKKFYEGMLKNGQTPAQALRTSQVWISQQKQWAHPYYWAGFVLQGEWR